MGAVAGRAPSHNERYVILDPANVVYPPIKEHAALLLPLFLLTLLHPSYRRWLRSPHVYLAAAGFVALLVPDLLWNLKTNPEIARVSYGSGEARPGQLLAASAADRRYRSVPSTMFYTRSAVQRLHMQVTGRELGRDASPSINPALGALLLGSLLVSAIRPGGRDRLMSFLLLVFWGDVRLLHVDQTRQSAWSSGPGELDLDRGHDRSGRHRDGGNGCPE